MVRKVLRSGETSFEYEREVQPRPKLGQWTAELEQLLSVNAVRPAREQLTLIRIFEELGGRGYGGGYDAVRRYSKRWAKQHGQATAAAYVPLSFAPGEAYQFDWSHEVVLLSGVTVLVSREASAGPSRRPWRHPPVMRAIKHGSDRQKAPGLLAVFRPPREPAHLNRSKIRTNRSRLAHGNSLPCCIIKRLQSAFELAGLGRRHKIADKLG